jgi:hypothetical protein
LYDDYTHTHTHTHIEREREREDEQVGRLWNEYMMQNVIIKSHMPPGRCHQAGATRQVPLGGVLTGIRNAPAPIRYGATATAARMISCLRLCLLKSMVSQAVS